MKPTHRFGVLAALVLAMACSIGVGTAHASTYFTYCGFRTDPKTRCFAEVDRHSYISNVASGRSIDGSNQYLAKCERMTAYNDYENIFSRKCGTGIQIIGRWNDFCGGCGNAQDNPGNLLKVYVGNDDYAPQIMWGSTNY